MTLTSIQLREFRIAYKIKAQIHGDIDNIDQSTLDSMSRHLAGSLAHHSNRNGGTTNYVYVPIMIFVEVIKPNTKPVIQKDSKDINPTTEINKKLLLILP